MFISMTIVVSEAAIETMFIVTIMIIAETSLLLVTPVKREGSLV